MSQNPAANRVVQARMLAANNRYEESLTVYAEVLAREPTNGAVFMEMLRVKELLTGIKSTLQLMQLTTQQMLQMPLPQPLRKQLLLQ
ncbi:MAG TPA: hypothetical protein PLD10_21385 [Rhodopila sp.]|nr:hypothetical protein [Rhodopila sp.]